MYEDVKTLRRKWRGSEQACATLGEHESDVWIDDWLSVFRLLPKAHKGFKNWEALYGTDPSFDGDMTVHDCIISCINGATQKAANYTTCAAGDICQLGRVTDTVQACLDGLDVYDADACGGERSGLAYDAIETVTSLYGTWKLVDRLSLGFYQAVRYGDVKEAKQIYKDLEKILSPHASQVRKAYTTLVRQNSIPLDGHDYEPDW